MSVYISVLWGLYFKFYKGMQNLYGVLCAFFNATTPMCRSPPTNMNFKFVLIGGFYLEDINKRKEYTIKEFKSYMEYIISNLQINFIRIYRKRNNREIIVDKNYIERISGETQISEIQIYEDFKYQYLKDDKILKEINKLTKTEKIVIEDLVNDIPVKNTAKKLKTTDITIRVLRNRARNKLKKGLGYER